MKIKNENQIIPSVNYHLWNPCNMKCKFCFAPFQEAKNILPKGHLPKEQSLQLIREIAGFGFEKITFAGGEPTLCPWISELIREAKISGMTTMIVTNGSRLSDDFLEKNKTHLDWVILSVDSILSQTNLNSGRAMVGKNVLSFDDYLQIVDRIKKYGYRLKINTVVHSLNYQESMSEFINYAKPERWKVFQVLPIMGENDEFIDEFKINEEQFNQFITYHQSFVEQGILVRENNSEMIDSYTMIDPAGRFFTNKKGFQEYSKPILQIGIKSAYHEMGYNYGKFIKRGGSYKWN